MFEAWNLDRMAGNGPLDGLGGQAAPGIVVDEHQIHRDHALGTGLELGESVRSVIVPKAQLTHKIQPGRPLCDRDEQIQINGIARETEKNDRVSTNQQAWQIPLRCGVEDCGESGFQDVLPQ